MSREVGEYLRQWYVYVYDYDYERECGCGLQVAGCGFGFGFGCGVGFGSDADSCVVVKLLSKEWMSEGAGTSSLYCRYQCRL
jgi:hypothetical protein